MPSKFPSLGELFFQSMITWSGHIAQQVPHSGYSDTYGEFLTKCIRTAMKLQELGVRDDDIIGICTLNEENACVPFVASQLIGAKAASLDIKLSKENIIYLLKEVEPKILFVSIIAEKLIEDCLKEAGVQTQIVVLGTSGSNEEFHNFLKPRKDEEKFKPVSKDENETAVICFTSGSTGNPKGVCLSHYSLSHQYVELDESDASSSIHFTVLHYSTLYWISAISVLIRNIVQGMPLILCNKFDPVETWKIVAKYQVEILLLPPSSARECVESLPKDCNVDHLRFLIIGGDKATLKLLEDVTSALPNVSVMNCYSQTEFAGHCLLSIVVKRDDIIKRSQRVLSCGKVPPNCEWRVVDPTSEKILGPNEEGELRIKCKYFMTGYYKRDSSSVYDSDGYMKTGDLFYYDEEENLYVIGRIKSVFKFRGWRVSPTVMEEILMSHIAVEDAIVIDVPNERDGNHPMGFVKLKKGYEDTECNAIKEFAEGKLEDSEKLRGGLKVVEYIPYTVTGKKERGTFRKTVLNGLV